MLVASSRSDSPSRGGWVGCRQPWSCAPSGRADRAGPEETEREDPSPAVREEAMPAPATRVVTGTGRHDCEPSLKL
jgi:hypothetical protein